MSTETATLEPVTRRGRALILRTFSKKAREIVGAQKFTKRLGPIILVPEAHKLEAVEALKNAGISISTPPRNP